MTLNNEEIRTAIGQQLREARKARHDTQRRLAQIIGVSRQMIVRYEKGMDTPTGEAFLKVVRYMGFIELHGQRFAAEALERPSRPTGVPARQLELPLHVPQEFPNTTIRVTRNEDSIEIHALIIGSPRG